MSGFVNLIPDPIPECYGQDVRFCRDEERLPRSKAAWLRIIWASAGSGQPCLNWSPVDRTSCLGSGSACQAGEPCRRLPVAVRAPRREPRWGDAEDSGKPLDLPFGESPLPAIAAAFSGTHGGVAQPAHQFTELGLVPAVLLAQDPDVRADDSSLAGR